MLNVMVTIIDQFPKPPAPDLLSQDALPPLNMQEARPFRRYVATRRRWYQYSPSLESHTPADWDVLLAQNPRLRASLESQFGSTSGLWRILSRHKKAA